MPTPSAETSLGLLNCNNIHKSVGRFVSRARTSASHPEHLSGKARMEKHENHRPAHDFEYLHDFCVVWPFEVPKFRSLESDFGELGDRFF